MLCSGRTQRNVAVAPAHRLRPGQAPRIARPARRRSRSAVGRARLLAARRSRTGPCRSRAPRPRRATSRPAARRKPSIACSGAPTRGPLRSSRTSGWRSGRPSTTSARRRGVTKASARCSVSCALSSPSHDQALQILGGARLHARRDLLGEQLEQQFRHRGSAPHPEPLRSGEGGARSSSPSRERGGPPRSGGRVRASPPPQPLTAARQPGLAAGLGQRAHAADVGGALGDADDAAGVQQVEEVAGLDALVVGRQHQRLSAAPAAPGTPPRRRRSGGTAVRCRRARSCRPSLRARSAGRRRRRWCRSRPSRGRRRSRRPGCTSPAARGRRSARPTTGAHSMPPTCWK